MHISKIRWKKKLKRLYSRWRTLVAVIMPMSNLLGILCILCAVCGCFSYYLPGVSPRSYQQYEAVSWRRGAWAQERLPDRLNLCAVCSYVAYLTYTPQHQSPTNRHDYL